MATHFSSLTRGFRVTYNVPPTQPLQGEIYFDNLNNRWAVYNNNQWWFAEVTTTTSTSTSTTTTSTSTTSTSTSTSTTTTTSTSTSTSTTTTL